MTVVVAQHCGLAPFGWTGVWLFYVISGFVIARNFYRSSYADNGQSVYLLFMKRRFLRIVPVYAIYILLCSAVLLAAGNLQALRLRCIDRSVRKALDIHVVLDNYGTDKTSEVRLGSRGIKLSSPLQADQRLVVELRRALLR